MKTGGMSQQCAAYYSGQVWYQEREGTLGLRKTFIGTQLETGQESSTLAKVSQGAKIVDLIYFKRAPSTGVCSTDGSMGSLSRG